MLAWALGFVAAIWLIHWGMDARRTALPFGTTDLSSVQTQLKRLSDSDRALVEAYVKRSNGDVLPASMADPDDPLTARSFAEAIELQKRWNLKMDEQAAAAAVRAAQRDLAMAPLRETVTARVARRELLSPNQVNDISSENGGASSARRDDRPTVFVATIAIENLGDEAIVGLQGVLEARDRDNYLSLQLCWIDLNEQQPVPARETTEIRCSNPNRAAD